MNNIDIWVTNHGTYKKGIGITGIEFMARTTIAFKSGNKYIVEARGSSCGEALGNLMLKAGRERFNINIINIEPEQTPTIDDEIEPMFGTHIKVGYIVP